MQKENARILVVDDDLIFGKNFVTILRYEGYTVELASTGNKAVDMLSGGDFNIVLLDIKLPDLNGLEIFKKVKEVQPKAAVILMSAYPFDKDLMSAIEKESLPYFCKPFDINSILDTIKKISS